MQALLDQLNALLLSWKAITLQNTLLDLVIIGLISAIGFWFLLALYYHAKMAKARNRSQKTVFLIEQERAQLSATLDATGQQLVQTEHTLSDKQQQLQIAQAAADRGAALENQVAEALTSLQMGALAQESLLGDSGVASGSASSWERYHTAVDTLTNRLQTLQQEKTRLNAVLTDNALTIRSLQQENAGWQAQISVLEQDIETQQAAVQGLQQSVVLLKAEVAKASIPATAALNQFAPKHEAVQDPLENTDSLFEKISQQVDDVVEDVVGGIESALHSVGQAIEPDLPTLVDKPIEKPAAVTKLKKMFGFGKSTPSSEPPSAIVIADNGKPTTEPDSLLLLEQVSNASDYGKSKLKNAFGRFGKSNLVNPSANQVVEAATKQDSPHVSVATAINSVASDNAPQVEESKAKSIFGRFGKSKSTIQSETAVENTNSSAIPDLGLSSGLSDTEKSKAKSIFGRFNKSDLVQQAAGIVEQVAPKNTTPVSSDSAADTGGFKLKNIFKRFNKESIAESVEAALEKNDAEVAEQLSGTEESSASVPKSKSFWRKMTLTK